MKTPSSAPRSMSVSLILFVFSVVSAEASWEWWTKSFRSLRSTVGGSSTQEPDEQAASCSCDCCLTVLEEQANSSIARGDIKCAPRASAPAFTDGDGGCKDVCDASDGANKAFNALSGKVDYSRFCLSACHPGDDEVNMLCVDGQAEGQEDKRANTGFSQQRVQVNQQAASQAPGNKAALFAAREEMQRARAHALAAGEAARTAREAYEYLARIPPAAAQKVARETMNEIKHEAAVQSRTALVLRMQYEQNSRETALKAAYNAALPYKKSLLESVNVARQWHDRETQFMAAADQRQGIADEAEKFAARAKMNNNWASARDYAMKAQQMTSVAASFRKSAEAAGEEAKKIDQTAPWYIYAEEAAAKVALVTSMPTDVAPPTLPPLP